MANIQPFDYQKSTNIEEHNQIVNKVNEIVQVINDVNLETINTEIANLKSKATETDTEIANIKDKDTTQDTEINGITKSLVSNVTATFDNPSRELKISLGREASPSIDATVVIPSSSETGQYSAGNGITIQDYQIAVDTGVVALKTDIPVVPDVSEITNRLDTIDGEITGINADITNITNKNTEQDTAINGKVAISQGVENSGKVLGIGSDGNVTPVDAGGTSGGEVWEEIDFNNFPTDWVAGDLVRMSVQIRPSSTDISKITSWSTNPSTVTNHTISYDSKMSTVIQFMVREETNTTLANPVYIPLYGYNTGSASPPYFWLCYVEKTGGVTNLNNNGKLLLGVISMIFNGAGAKITSLNIGLTNYQNYITKMWRCRASP